MTPSVPPLAERLREARVRRAFEEARALIRSEPGFASSPRLHAASYEHEDFWWAPIEGRRVALRRRSARDLEFVRACWADADFMRKFNRTARPLPSDDHVLAHTLDRECAGTLSESRALHWTIHAPSGPIGFVSATDYSAAHRRCEFLVGVLRQAPGLAPMEAAYLATEFLRTRARIERLTAYFYPENVYAARVAEKFGFEREGVLKAYLRNADGTRGDLVIAGMLLDRAGRCDRTQNRILNQRPRGSNFK